MTIPANYNLLGTQMPWWLVISMRNRWYLKNYVECGAGYGDSSSIACDHFSHIWSIELLPEVFNHQFKDLTSAKNATRLQGTTLKHLPEVVKQSNAPTLFYIDSHWTGMGDRIQNECPILEEIKIIGTRSEINKDVIMIDNAGMFIHSPNPPHDASQWPNVQQVVDALKNDAKQQFVQLVVDVIIATPEPLYLMY